MIGEQQRIDAIAAASRYAAGVNAESVRYCFGVFARHLAGDSILELGAAEGVMTELLVATGKALTVLEGSAAFCASLSRRFPSARVERGLFEGYQPSATFDNVVLGHVLEHVQDPVQLLRRARAWLAPGGRLLAAVPNSKSLHRQAAVMMSLLATEDELNDADRAHGHRRVFDPESFRQAFIDAGCSIRHFGGYWLKPLSNRQIEEAWSPALIAAYMRLGERYPEIAGEIYIVAAAAPE